MTDSQQKCPECESIETYEIRYTTTEQPKQRRFHCTNCLRKWHVPITDSQPAKASEPHWTDRFVGKPENRGDLEDCQIATDVRMLTRNDLDHEMVVCAARDRIARLSRQVRDLTRQLAAATDRAEQAEASCAALRDAVTSKHDTPSSLIEGLRAYALCTYNAEKAWHTTIANKLEAALASSAGKSASEELRRLREENLQLRKILAHVPGRVALKAKEGAGYGEQIHTKEQP